MKNVEMGLMFQVSENRQHAMSRRKQDDKIFRLGNGSLLNLENKIHQFLSL